MADVGRCPGVNNHLFIFRNKLRHERGIVDAGSLNLKAELVAIANFQLKVHSFPLDDSDLIECVFL